ncbi:YggT family protein [Liquorilactobacillus satsumensis]|uniref:YggT family protein n=1 Tax=Liquorilactobacillus satsumensis TaxID=259059 RepID=UPI0006D253B6|nr:YggT family protein [Liquorilactobacillus satsumensis]MCC7665584.1 YggT family protein [Liquorilactobacillus satsumensis]MCP9311796.1 YggT family protein [Liquorilactobacillus satsumensis]MCP9328404.1 YggT family protein [Liquorilactobacillus satsumensis]MCP9357342.1 YggT family protein [Liquorilactobacillus satsumensis]MCP9358929.1 YggT family protein [Liquorilactobacillus satsumensis]
MILTIVNRLFQLYSLALVVYVLMTWFPGALQSRLGVILGRFCEPYLAFFDRFIPTFGGISFSPIVALLALLFVQNGVNLVLTSLLSALGFAF